MKRTALQAPDGDSAAGLTAHRSPRSAMSKVWTETHPETSPLPTLAGADGVCTPDGCVVPDRSGT